MATNIGHDDYMKVKLANEAALNGPAFPAMKLRDFFAASAMQGLCAADNVMTYTMYAEQSYRLADAMLEARTKYFTK